MQEIKKVKSLTQLHSYLLNYCGLKCTVARIIVGVAVIYIQCTSNMYILFVINMQKFDASLKLLDGILLMYNVFCYYYRM